MSNVTTNDQRQREHYKVNCSLQNNDNNNTFEVISSDNLMNNSAITTEAVHIGTTNTSYINHVDNDNGHINHDADDDDDSVAAAAAATDTLNFINGTVMSDIFSQNVVSFVEPAIVNNKRWDSAVNDNDNATLTSHIFNTPNSHIKSGTSSAATNNFDDEETQWHGSSDLLELDHRYNSCLQAELMQNESTSVILNAVDAESLADLNEYIELKSKPLSVSEEQKSFSNSLSPPTSKTHNHKQLPIVMEQQKSLQHQQIEQNQQILRVSSDSESDFEDRNLSWLLNFKFDELPHLSPDTAALNSKGKMNLNLNNLNIQSLSKNFKKGTACQSSFDFSVSMPNATLQNQNQNNSDGCTSPMKAGKKFEELVMEATSEMDCNDNTTETESVAIDDMSFRMGKKPPFTYTELIEYALEDKGELTVSGIYQWISDRFPYYKSNDDRWKNSVRHNLSINPHFRKGAKASQGAGHLWTISSGDSAESALAWEHKKQRLELFFKMESANIKRIQQHKLKYQKYEKEQQQQQQQKQQQRQQQQQYCSGTFNISSQHENSFDDEAATAADIITREMILQQQQQQQPQSQQPNEATNHQTHCDVLNDQHMDNVSGTITTIGTTNFVQELPFNDLICEEELRRAAGQILNGIHRDVEVQSVNSHIYNYQNILLENDYLCESSLQHSTNFNSTISSNYGSTTNQQNLNNISSQFNISEIDPMELGIQMSHHVDNEEILFNDELGLNFFGYNVNSDIAT